MSGSTSDLSYTAYEREAAKLTIDDPNWKEKHDFLQLKYKQAIADYNASKGSTPPRTSSTLPPHAPSHVKVWECFQQLTLLRQHQVGHFQKISDYDLYSLATEHIVNGLTVEEVRDHVHAAVLQQQQQEQQFSPPNRFSDNLQTAPTDEDALIAEYLSKPGREAVKYQFENGSLPRYRILSAIRRSVFMGQF